MARSDLQSLRRSLARRLREKAELEQTIRAAHSQFEEEVAPLQEEVLRLQMARLKEAAQARMRSARLRNAYHDAQEAYDAFQERRQQASPRTARSDPDLKGTYRRATKLCHPDTVADPYREEATATFRALESAFDAEHPAAVQAIANSLETWGFPRAPTAPPESSRPGTKESLRHAVSELEASIERLHASGVYEAVPAAEDADPESALRARKRALRKRLRTLKRRPSARV
ncbi:hypothetical protein [Salinibacter altiplanensis]|uniref:hypothetical protein n=1 Tax=Salinibacter altiplanensis TaxID=1803181 RepID=UPI00131A520D|nr:hypothetical protein [Salinibacter altiplanensis]